jgi:GTP:adenosylcobinamide-phosphate guanylyltransferase
MKVDEDRGRLVRIGKTLTSQQTSGESIGLLAFRGAGPQIFASTVERLMHKTEGTTSWYLRAIDGLADSVPIATLSIQGMEWAEVDYPQDYEAASALAARWDRAAGSATSTYRSGAPMGNWTALVLAGERPGGDPLAQAMGLPAKALVSVSGEPMLNHVVRSLLDAPQIGRVLVLAQKPERLGVPATEWIQREERVRFMQSGEGISSSIEAVVGGKDAPWPVLITTADHPLLTADIVSDFVTQVGNSDVAVGAVERKVVLDAYPSTKRTWLHFSDGAYSGANLFALTSNRVKAALALWAEVEADRKRAYRLFWHFGPALALRAITRTISFERALDKAGRNLGLQARLVGLQTPEAAIDVDKLSDLRLVESILAAGTSHSHANNGQAAHVGAYA